MREDGGIKMVGRVGGVMGELGRKSGRRDYEGNFERPVNVEIISVGRLFREPDLRRFESDMRAPPFIRLYPI